MELFEGARFSNIQRKKMKKKKINENLSSQSHTFK